MAIHLLIYRKIVYPILSKIIKSGSPTIMALLEKYKRHDMAMNQHIFCIICWIYVERRNIHLISPVI